MIVRPAELNDSLDILSWRNDLHTRNMSFDTSLVSSEDHVRWFGGALQSDDHYFYIGIQYGQKIGVCRYHLSLDRLQCEVSINLNPQHRGRGLAEPFLLLSMEQFLSLHAVPVLARIKNGNIASIRTFEACGYEQLPSSNGALAYRY